MIAKKSIANILFPLLCGSLTSCAIYGPQFGIGDYAQFCSNIGVEDSYNNQRFTISDRGYFYVAQDGSYYSDAELDQIKKLSVIDPSAKELVDSAKKIITVKISNTKDNKNICLSALSGTNTYSDYAMKYIPGRAALVSSGKKIESQSGKELYNNYDKDNNGLTITVLR